MTFFSGLQVGSPTIPKIKTFATLDTHNVATLLWEECEDETHTPEMGTWESIGTLKILEFDCRG
jgi:hypothetical protein